MVGVSLYRHIYYEALEVVFGEVERRFDQPDLQIFGSDAANGEECQISDTLSSFTEGDIDQARVNVQFTMITYYDKDCF